MEGTDQVHSLVYAACTVCVGLAACMCPPVTSGTMHCLHSTNIVHP
jgi:hypothetical protein